MMSIFTRTIFPEQPFFVFCSRLHQQRRQVNHPLISDYYDLELADTQDQVIAIPDGCVDILFECNTSQAHAWICGTTLSAKTVQLHAGVHYFGVRFHPGVIPQFQQLAAHELLDQEYKLLDILPQANVLIEQIIKNNHFEQRIRCFEQFMNQHFMHALSDISLAVLKCIYRSTSQFKIKELEQLTGYSSRHIQRTFKQDTGLCPKSFFNMMRFQSAIQRLQHAPQHSLSDLAYDLGYNDQSHFSKDFKKYGNTSPHAFLNQVHYYAGQILHC
ncbi:helix-turn-helix domain-containing protein [Acinetobacter sp. ANC 5383]